MTNHGSDKPDDVASQKPTDAKQSSKPTMSVKVYAPFRVFYEGDAFSLSAVNAVGPFDILPKHRNFICMLVPCDIKIDTPSAGSKSIRVNRALMHVKADRVVVFVDV